MSQSEPPKIHVEWPEYFGLLHKLFGIIADSGFKPKQVVCIARGGLIPGDLASRFFSVPLAILSVSSYPDGATGQEVMHFSRELTSAKPLEHEGVLVMDDLTETGMTLDETVKWLCHWYRLPREQVRTATIWHKPWSKFKPDFFAAEVLEGPNGEKPWIVQPQESFRRGAH